MAKINQPKAAEKIKIEQNGLFSEKGNKVLSLINIGNQEINILAATYSNFIATVDSRKDVEVENYVKKSNAEVEVQKEMNRHNEAMETIEQEWKKIADNAKDRGLRLSFIKEQIERFQTEYDQYMAMDNEAFLSETVTSRLASLRKVILDLTKELNKV